MLVENVCFEGAYASAKEYLQPILKTAALSFPLFLNFGDKTRTALLVAATYAVLNLFGSIASRKSHALTEKAGGEFNASGLILLLALFCYIAVGVGFIFGMALPAIIAFIIIGISVNIWKPVFVSRFYEMADRKSGATALSIVSQTKTLSLALAAPILGWLVDFFARGDKHTLISLMPVAAYGLILAVTGLLFHLKARD
jgi:hypothetical protein